MINDEKIITALLESKTIRQAADNCGISETQIYARLRESTFKERYAEARREMLEAAKNRLQAEMGASVGTLAAVRDDATVSPQVKINAADALLRHAYRLTEIIDILERIERLEKLQQKDGD